MGLHQTFTKLALIITLALTLVGCGGGGGGSSPSQNANLADISIASVTLSPAFSPDEIDYTASVLFAVDSISVNADLEDSGASITINDEELTSGGITINLSVGENTITIVVTAAGGATQTYTVTVTRGSASSNADLRALSVSTGTLSPSFSPGQLTYTAPALFAATSFTVTPTVDDTTASVTVDGVAVASGSVSNAIAFSGPQQTVQIVVTAEDGTTQTYSITVQRQDISTNANLTNLALSTGALTPAFSSDTTSYTATVDFTVDEITVTPTVDDVTAAVTVGGNPVNSGTASAAIALTIGSNNIPVAVTAEDGSTVKTYTIIVTRSAPSSNANLSDLTLSKATFDQLSFDSAQTSYTASAHFLVPTTTATATVADNTATLKINGTTIASGATSAPISLPVGSSTISATVTAQDGTTTQTYAVDVTRGDASTFDQLIYAKASNSDSSDQFGYSVALDGDILAVSAWREDGGSSRSGAVYIFERNPNDTGWTQQGYLKASNAEEDDSFGFSIALSGGTLVVGARDEDSASSGINGDESSNAKSNAGAVYVFVRNDLNDWSQQAYIKAPEIDNNDKFGSIVAISGDTLVVGSPEFDRAGMSVDDNAGAAFVYTRDGTGTWSQQAQLVATEPDADDLFGGSVSIFDDTIAVGAAEEDGGATGINGDATDNSALSAGATYIFTRSGSTWSQQAYIKPSNTAQKQNFGGAVSLSSDTLAVGAPREDGVDTGINGDQTPHADTETNTGAVYIFKRDGVGNWTQQAYLKSSNSESGDEFGTHVSLYSDTLAVGARWEDSGVTGVNANEGDNSKDKSGAVYLFTRDASSNWTQDAYVKASNPGTSDEFGWAVAVSERNLIVGAYKEDSASQGTTGADQSNNSNNDSGAIYIFE